MPKVVEVEVEVEALRAEEVVNGQTLSEVLALPARSFTPVEPPLIVAVYDVEDASEDEGANVSYRTTLS